MRDIIPTRTAPVATLLLIALNAALFVHVTVTGPGSGLEADTSTAVLITGFRWTEMVSSIFVHSGWLHLVANLGALWLFGVAVEDRMGHARFVVFYVATGFAGALVRIVMSGDVLTPVGATSATGAVMGAYFFLFPRSRVLVLLPLIVTLDVIETPALFLFGLWFALQVIAAGATIEPKVAAGGAIWAGVAGFALGWTVARVFRQRDRLRVEWWDGRRQER